MLVYMAHFRSEPDHGRMIIPFRELEDVHFFVLRHFGLEENFKALSIRFENFTIIVLEGDGAMISGNKDREGSFPLTSELSMTK